jgi:hypothetical protein
VNGGHIPAWNGGFRSLLKDEAIWHVTDKKRLAVILQLFPPNRQSHRKISTGISTGGSYNDTRCDNCTSCKGLQMGVELEA